MALKYSLLTIIWAVTVAVLLLIPGDKFPEEQPFLNIDKVVHVGIFGILSFLFVNSIKNSTYKFIKGYRIVFSFIITFTYSIILELLQYYVPMRQFDGIDILSNGIGVTLGLILFTIIYKF